MIITLDEFKEYSGITSSQYDAFLESQITIVSEAVEEYCRRVFGLATYVQTFYREEFPSDLPVKDLPLYQYPLKTITAIVESCIPSQAYPSPTQIPVTDYRFHKPSAKLTKNFGNFFCNGDLIEVTYEAGYDQVPSPVKAVVYGIVQEKYNKKLNGVDINFGSDIQRISIPGTISIDYDYSLTSNDRKTPLGKILGDYVNILDVYRSERAVVGSIRPAYVS